MMIAIIIYPYIYIYICIEISSGISMFFSIHIRFSQGTCVEGASEEVFWVDCRSAQVRNTQISPRNGWFFHGKKAGETKKPMVISWKIWKFIYFFEKMALLSKKNMVMNDE